MARLFIDGFETGDGRCWDGFTNGTSWSAISAGSLDAIGSYCWRCWHTCGMYKNVSPATPSTLYAKAYIRMGDNGPADGTIFSFGNGSGTQIELYIASDGSLAVKSGSMSGTVLASCAAGTIVPSTPYLLEMKVVIDSSVGVAQVKLGGSTVIDFSGNTHYRAADTITVFTIGNEPSGVCDFYYDHLVLDDANWIGDGSIVPLIPNGAGGVTQLTPSSGANYGCVNPVPATDAQNVSTNTPDQEDSYVKATITGTYVVNCVQLTTRAKAEGSPACGGIEALLRIGGTDYVGARGDVPIGSYANKHTLWQINPATSSPFTLSELNALDIGAKLVA